MAKRYIVDLRSLPPAERLNAFNRIEMQAFLATEWFGESGLEGADVIWDSSEDFPTSQAFPRGCSYQEIK